MKINDILSVCVCVCVEEVESSAPPAMYVGKPAHLRFPEIDFIWSQLWWERSYFVNWKTHETSERKRRRRSGATPRTVLDKWRGISSLPQRRNWGTRLWHQPSPRGNISGCCQSFNCSPVSLWENHTVHTASIWWRGLFICRARETGELFGASKLNLRGRSAGA